MASIARDPGGRYRVLFVAPDGRRVAIRLGKLSKRGADKMKLLIERLLECQRLNVPMDAETAGWVAALDHKTADKLIQAGLLSHRAAGRYMLGQFLEDYIRRRPDAAARTIIKLRQCASRLTQYFGASRDIATITPGDARDWAAWLRTPEARIGRYADRTTADGLSENTARRMAGVARQLFTYARQHKLITENPFDGIPGTTGPNTEREYFVTRDETERLLAVLPSAEWRAMVALARYGALRCPSEILGLRWCDVDWERRRMVIHSPKTSRKGYGARIVPIFAELAPYLEEAWAAAPEGAEYVVTRYRSTAVNLRTQLTRYILRAGLRPWPKLWHSLRQSRAIELAREYPAHVATAWCGHTAQVALRHYWRVTDDDFERAARLDSTSAPPLMGGGAKSGALGVEKVAQKAAQQLAATISNKPQTPSNPLESGDLLRLVACRNSLLHKDLMGDDRLELSTSTL